MGGASRELIIDDRASGDLVSALGTCWRLVTDGVMGGVSSGTLVTAQVEGVPCLRMRGQVSLENNGGFVQAALDLSSRDFLDATCYEGVALDVLGNGETYNVHLRTADITQPWQSYRASFLASPCWQRVILPFGAFVPHRINRPLDLRRLRRMGLVAIGRAFCADLCVGRVVLYGGAP